MADSRASLVSLPVPFTDPVNRARRLDLGMATAVAVPWCTVLHSKYISIGDPACRTTGANRNLVDLLGWDGHAW